MSWHKRKRRNLRSSESCTFSPCETHSTKFSKVLREELISKKDQPSNDSAYRQKQNKLLTQLKSQQKHHDDLLKVHSCVDSNFVELKCSCPWMLVVILILNCFSKVEIHHSVLSAFILICLTWFAWFVFATAAKKELPSRAVLNLGEFKVVLHSFRTSFCLKSKTRKLLLLSILNPIFHPTMEFYDRRDQEAAKTSSKWPQILESKFFDNCTRCFSAQKKFNFHVFLLVFFKRLNLL